MTVVMNTIRYKPIVSSLILKIYIAFLQCFTSLSIMDKIHILYYISSQYTWIAS